MKIAKGFYTALGTPQDQYGAFLQDSFMRQVQDQIHYGASGLLVMGSMGLGVFLRDHDYAQVARAAVHAAEGACPVFVGVTDTSVGRACDRIDALAGLAIEGVVSTPPYYYAATTREQINYYGRLASHSPFPVYLYDLPVASRSKITLAAIQGLAGEKNIRGIKTADLPLAETLQNMVVQGELQPGFRVLYSGLDTFDQAGARGIGRHLDGMFACTGPLARNLYQAVESGDTFTAADNLRKIIALRDLFAAEEIMPSFTCAMNLLGYEGSFGPDYYFSSTLGQRDAIERRMQEYQLL